MRGFQTTFAITLVIAFLQLSPACAQITTDDTLTPQELVELLVGSDVDISNVSFTGGSGQRGSFLNNNGNLTIAQGIILSSGNIAEVIGPNDGGGTTGNTGGGGGGNADLALLSGLSMNDAAVLEFDFVATGDSLQFNYSFGSEEYNEYVCGSVNDAFGLFLDGPGINGPYSNNSINLAIIPGTADIPVSINTLNNGNVGANGSEPGCSDLDPNWVNNAVYFIDNDPNSDPNATQMDGFTVTLTAGAALQCGETYHLRFAIADGGDSAYDSVVMLEAGSFSAGSVDLNAEAVPSTVEGLENVVPYEESVGLPAVFQYNNGESFPYGAWTENNDLMVTVDGQDMFIDAVIIEGCNDAQFSVVRPETQATTQDTLLLTVSGTADQFLDFQDAFYEVIMTVGQTSADVVLGVRDDGVPEGIEHVGITYTYVNGCGDEVVTSSTVVILDPLPILPTPSAPGCLQIDGTQVLGYDDISGYGPFEFVAWGQFDSEAAIGDLGIIQTPGVGLSFDATFDMTDDEGELISGHLIDIEIVDQCGNSIIHTQEILHPKMNDKDLCSGDRDDFPMQNAGIPVQDLLFNGVSLIDTVLPGVPFTIDALPNGGHWVLNQISASFVEFNWKDTLTMVDTCGYETRAVIEVIDCVIPNVFSPDNNGQNDSFRVRGLNGYEGSRLVIYNRYGTVVFEDETATDEEFELVWNGNTRNGNDAPDGHYQWVLIRSDGLKDSGDLHLLRRN